MVKAMLFCGVLFSSCLVGVGQNFDYLWHLGQNSQSDSAFAGVILEFTEDSLITSTVFRNTFFYQANTSACDSEGNVLFYTNGQHVANANGEIMENGSGLNPGELASIWLPYGYILEQGILTVPYPGVDSLYLLLHLDREFIEEGKSDTHSRHLYYTLIDFRENNGLGAVIEKNQILLDDSYMLGKLNAVKHANGRDWWVLVRKFGSNVYDRVLVSESGITQEEEIVSSTSVPVGLGQSVFSPDGSKFAYLSITGFQGDPIYLEIYDFDRCTGVLNLLTQHVYADSAVSGGLAISPNSRFLYVSSYKYLYQFDLWSSQIEETKDTVAVWDEYYDAGLFGTSFYLAQLAPDGKIYINTNNGSRYLHVIETPNLPGENSSFCQRCVYLGVWNNFSLPNFPNYRLHYLEGSPCDTLREPPTASFEYDTENLTAAFSSTSTHDIRTWYWTFGDGATDTLIHPIHSYEEEGVYEVCLTVTNPRGEDTHCEQIAVLVDDVEGFEERMESLRLFPNPSAGVLEVRLPRQIKNARLEMYDASGKKQRVWILGSGLSSFIINVEEYSPGVYFLHLRGEQFDVVEPFVLDK